MGTALIGKGLSYTWELEGCIDDAPTIDAVPVIRCKNCKHLVDGYMCYEGIVSVGYRKVSPDGFCERGEKKDV